VGLGWPGPIDASPDNLVAARTMCLMTMSFSQLFHAINCRSELGSVLGVGLFANPKLLLAFFTSGLLQLGIVYLPGVSRFFSVVDIHGARFLESVGLAAFMLVAGELVKALSRVRRAGN